MPRMQDLLERAPKVLIGNYAREPVVFVRGEGSFLWDADGGRYLDLFAGFGGAILGHAHPALVAAASQQAQKLWHVGNVFYNEPQIRFAERLAEVAFTGKAFFCHSGAEANEAACKLARLRGNQRTPKRWKIISLERSFHGRTLAMIAATGNPKVRVGFEPEVPGFVRIPGGDFDALRNAVDDETAGVILEPIQGEGGINLYPPDYPHLVRQFCDQRGLTLIFDEVWTGCGRTGDWFAHQHFRTPDGRPITPDIMTLGKAVGGGLPVGVMWARPELAELLGPGTHGSTLGGNAICMAVAREIFDIIEREKLLDHARRLGQRAIERFTGDRRLASKIAAVRGRGLMLGIELTQPPDKLPARALQRGVIINLTAQKVIRLAPAINIPAELWSQGLDMVAELIAALE